MEMAELRPERLVCTASGTTVTEEVISLSSWVLAASLVMPVPSTHSKLSVASSATEEAKAAAGYAMMAEEITAISRLIFDGGIFRGILIFSPIHVNTA
ncbi:hypothetical protein ACQUFY_26020 (plasmid) [Robbsia andropogonis]|uniref:hypothetical protein n=1 Tax=Robbsia andropogonis TaxID=28092 RepID=UPI003D190AB9